MIGTTSLTRLLLVTGAVLLLTAAAPAPPRAPDGPGAAIDRWVEEEAGRAGYPGIAVAVTRGDRVVHLAGYGHDSRGAPITPDSPMPIASLSKSFTALAVLRLVEAGRFTLDAPVHDLLPGFAVDDPRGDEITVRHLLEQTSGITDATLAEKSLTQPGDLDGAVVRARAATLATPPGTRHAYSNTNYHLAAALVQAVTGEPFDTHLRREILAPLGMRASTPIDRTPGALPADVPRGHLYAYGAALPAPEPDRFVEGSDGIISTARDMTAWLALQSTGAAPDGTRLVPDRALTAMHTPSAPDRTYAMGWQTRPDGGVQHSGAWFTGTAQQVLLPSGYGIAVLGNTGIGLTNEGLAAIADGIADILTGRSPASGPPIRLPVDLALAALTLLSAVLTVRRLRRTPAWVERAGDRPVLAVLRTVPRLLPAALAVALPRLLGDLIGGGRDLTHLQLAYYSPALVVWVGVAALGGGAVVITRAVVGLRARTAG